MMEYTKGEWKVEPATDYYAEFRVVAEDGKCLMNMWDYGDKALANANLIASAPDLYEALKAINDYVNYNNNPQQDKAKLQLEKALAKAEEGG